MIQEYLCLGDASVRGRALVVPLLCVPAYPTAWCTAVRLVARVLSRLTSSVLIFEVPPLSLLQGVDATAASFVAKQRATGPKNTASLADLFVTFLVETGAAFDAWADCAHMTGPEQHDIFKCAGCVCIASCLSRV